MDNDKNSKLGTRSENKSKKRKANRIYNILLTVVIVAIIAVAISIFTGNDDKSDLADDKITENKNTVKEDSSKKEVNSEDTEKNSLEGDKDEEASNQENEQNATEGNTIVENSGDSNVLETYVNDSWEPVGTTQTGEHVTNYSQDSIDWKEMERAIAYGAGLSEDNMTVWYIGNGGATNKAIGTVSPKNDGGAAYRVYIEWVDGQGWKPVKVELLKQNDKTS